MGSQGQTNKLVISQPVKPLPSLFSQPLCGAANRTAAAVTSLAARRPYCWVGCLMVEVQDRKSVV